METGKRPPPQESAPVNGNITSSSTQEPPAKRQATSKMNGPLTQDDVQLFQKEAIFRQMQVYKREKELIQTQMDQLQKKSLYHDEHLRLINVWWDQLLDQIKVSVDAEFPDTKDTTTDPLPPALSTAEPAFFSKHLSEKANLIKASLTPLFSIIKSSSSSKDSPDTQKLKDSVQQLQLNTKLLDSERQKLQNQVSDLDRQLTDVTFKYLNAEKRLDRLKSSTLQQIDAATKLHPNSSSDNSNDTSNNGNNDNNNDNNNNNNNNTDTISNNNNNSNSTDSSKNGDRTVSKEESEAQNLAAKQALAVSEKRSQEIQALQEKILNLTEQVSSLSSNLLNPSEDQVSSTPIFKNLKIQLEAQSNKISRFESQAAELSTENSTLLSERTKFKQDTETEFKHLEESLLEKLTKAEQDLARIRTARDDLVQDVALRKAKEADKINTLKELTELAEIRLARIKTLEQETERLQTEIDAHLKSAATTTTASDNNDELANQTKEELMARITKLQKQNGILSAELPGLEQAFNKAHEQLSQKVFDLVGREDKLNKLSLEKAKADQKYFSAMRAKEVVSMENKALKTQLAKSSEVIEQVRQSENKVNEKLSSFERLYANMKIANETMIIKVHNLQQQMTEQSTTIDNYKLQLDKAREEIKHKSQQIGEQESLRLGAEEQVASLKVQVEHHKHMVQFSHEYAGDSQLEALRSMTICSVCSKNWKNCAIKVCGHVFCMDCAKDRLNARLRKCPACNKQYSHSDLMAIHL